MKQLLFFILLGLFFVSCSSHKNYSHLQEKQQHYKFHTQNPVTHKLYAAYKRWEGVPYCYAGESKDGIDCSAFVQTIYKEAFEIQLPRTTTEQLKMGIKIKKTDLKGGDLLFFKTSYKGLHTGIYLENGNFIHASSRYGVKISSIRNSYWKKRYYQARRIFF